MAKERGTLQIVEVCRRLSPQMGEEAAHSHGGSFRYWFAGRMLVGVNVTNSRLPVTRPGELQIWVPAKSFSEVGGIQGEDLRSALRDGFAAAEQGVTDCVLRIASAQAAEAFLEQVKTWTGRPAGVPGIT